MKTRIFNWYFVTIGAILAFSAFANSQTCPGSPGCLDSNFGTEGQVLLQIHDSIPTQPEEIAIQSDGKIIAVAGGFSAGEKLLRVNADGTLDPTFGSGGIVTFTWSLVSGSNTYYGKVYSLAIQNIGGQERILVAGVGHLQSGRNVASNVLRVGRFMPDGSVDTSFGTNGNTVINTGYALTMALQSNGKILTVGDLGKLVRLNANGTIDGSFGTAGIVNSGYGRAIAVDAGGGVLVGGYKSIGNGKNSRNVMSVKRFSSSGAPDTAFGMSGTATADFGYSARADDLDIDILGNIVASGTSSLSSDIRSRDFAIARFTSNGLADTSFSADGKTTYDFLGLNDTAGGLSLQSDGRIVQGGQIYLGNQLHDIGLVRYNYDGSVDTFFGNAGQVVTGLLPHDFGGGALIQTDPICSCEKIVISGGATPYMTFARFLIE